MDVIPTPEHVLDWWDRLSERTRNALMDDPGGVVPAELLSEVAKAGPLCTLYVSREGQPGALMLTPPAEEYVQEQAALRDI